MTGPGAPRRASVGFVLVTLGIDAFGVGVVIPVIPELVRRLSGPMMANASIWVAILVSAYALTQFIAAPILGGLSDRFGRRPVILLSVGGICLNYILLAAAPSLGWILAGRLLAGATGANTAASTAYIADVTPPEQRAQRFGLVGATFGLGFVLGPALGGLVGEYWLRGPFVLSAVLAGLNALYGLLVLPESLAADARRPFDWRRANPIGSLAGMARDGFTLRLAGAWSGLWFGINVLQSVFVLYTTLRFRWTPVDNGLALACVGLCQALAQGFAVKPAVRRLGEPRAALLGCGLSAVAFAVYAFAPNGAVLFLGIALQSAGSIAPAAIRAMLSARGGATRQGELQGGLASVEGLTQIGAPLLAGGLLGAFSAPHAAIYFPGAPLLTTAAVYLVAMLCVASATRNAIKARAPAA
jgi:DHA1 family tetracycline resistance protein-like MFS transporter